MSDASFRPVVFLTAEALVAEALVMDLQVLRCPLGTSRHHFKNTLARSLVSVVGKQWRPVANAIASAEAGS
jgi:hypothetical protein